MVKISCNSLFCLLKIGHANIEINESLGDVKGVGKIEELDMKKTMFTCLTFIFFLKFIYLPNIKLCVTILALHLNNLSFALLCITSDNELSINEENELIL